MSRNSAVALETNRFQSGEDVHRSSWLVPALLGAHFLLKSPTRQQVGA